MIWAEESIRGPFSGSFTTGYCITDIPTDIGIPAMHREWWPVADEGTNARKIISVCVLIHDACRIGWMRTIKWRGMGSSFESGLDGKHHYGRHSPFRPDSLTHNSGFSRSWSCFSFSSQLQLPTSMFQLPCPNPPACGCVPIRWRLQSYLCLIDTTHGMSNHYF